MKISAVIWVKDEVDVLPHSVSQLLRLGVSSVSIMDDCSNDGTEIVIDSLCTTLPQVSRCTQVEDLTECLKVDGPVFGPILEREQPDWLMVTDPDEFWIARTGDLTKTRALESHDIVIVDRFNAALPTSGIDPACYQSDSALRKLDLITERKVLSTEAMAADPDLRWVEHQIVPKLLVRPDRVQEYGLGMHQIISSRDQTLRRARGQDIVIVHLPFTTYPRFERKVQNTADVFARFNAEHKGAIAWHWRRWLDLYQRGALPREFERQFFEAGALAAMRNAGRIATADEIFADRSAEATACRTGQEGV